MNNLGQLFTTADGDELTGLVAGDYFLDFMQGTITQPSGTTTNMNKSLNDIGMSQCNSIGVWISDADAKIFIGSTISLADHQLSHIVNNYGFTNVRVNIPTNSTPDASNQMFFMSSTDGWLGYDFPKISHQRDEVSGTSSDTLTTILSKHVGAYNQFLITTENGGSQSIDVTIEFSENGTDWFPDPAYSTAITVTAVAGSNFNAFASDVEHHFYRVRIVNSTLSAGHAEAFTIYYNFVKDRGV